MNLDEYKRRKGCKKGQRVFQICPHLHPNKKNEYGAMMVLRDSLMKLGWLENKDL